MCFKTPLICAFLCLGTLVASAQTLTCDDKIINRGTSQAEVAAKCGQPAQVDHNTVTTGGAVSSGGQPLLISGASTQIEVEVWTYNFGPDKLMQRIRFENGLVVSIQSMGYGF
jgi:hypothetical protein